MLHYWWISLPWQSSFSRLDGLVLLPRIGALDMLWAAEPGVGETWDVYNVDSIGTFVATGFGEGEDGELYIAAGWRLIGTAIK